MQIQRLPFALFGGQAQPGVGFDPVLRYALPGPVQDRQAALRRGEALQGGLLEQASGPPVILVRFQGLIAAQLTQGSGAPLSGGVPDPAQRGLLIRRNPCAGDVMQSEFQLGGGIASSGPLVECGQGRGDVIAGIGATGEGQAEQQDGETAGIQWTFRASAGACSMLSISAARA